jgi:type I restriction enzyme S subunit
MATETQFKQTDIGLIPEEWEVKKLGEIGATFGGLSGKSKKDFSDGNCPYIPFMNIMSNPVIDETYFNYVKIKKGESQHKATKGNLFFNGSSETPEEVGMCSILLNDIPNLYLNSFCFGFRLFKTANENGLFLVYYFRSNKGRQHFRLLAQGATRYNLSKTQLLKMEIALPSEPEQTRIATILSDMDSEIDVLEKKLSKTKELKQGLMQQLLTGKIRLV